MQMHFIAMLQTYRDSSMTHLLRFSKFLLFLTEKWAWNAEVQSGQLIGLNILCCGFGYFYKTSAFNPFLLQVATFISTLKYFDKSFLTMS